MARIAPLNPEQSSGKARELLEQVRSKLGTVPNIMRTMAHSPAVLEAYLNFSAALSGSKINPKLREQIALAAAQLSNCQYCASAHTLLGQKAGLSQQEIIQARKGTAADSKTKAALEFTTRMIKEHGQAGDEDINELKSAGFSDGEVCEIVANIALNLFTNYFNHTVNTDVDFPVVDMHLR